MSNSDLKKDRSKILLIFFGIISGISAQLNRLADNPDSVYDASGIFLNIIFGAVLFPLLFLSLRRAIRRRVSNSSLPVSVKERYPRYDTFTYAVFLFLIFGALGFQFTFTAVFSLMLIFLFLQLLLIYFLMDKSYIDNLFSSIGWLAFLFFISGFAAIIYQIVWQKVLFTAFGVNIESVTIIVSIFMLGLGIGSIAGGMISRRFPSRLPQFFLIFEFLIGVFGIASLPLIRVVSEASFYKSVFAMSFATFALLCFPTILMGATLPVLVTYLHKYYRNIGKSVGLLYFANTLGSAAACFITAYILFVLFGKQATVAFAALCNFFVGLSVYIYTLKIKKEQSSIQHGQTDREAYNGLAGASAQTGTSFLIFLLSGATGYISVSQEILWFRTLSYATGGKPDVFANVLGFFLAGLAAGALAAKKICEREEKVPFYFTAAVLSVSAVVYYLSLPFAGRLFTISETLGLAASYISVGMAAFLIGGIFPLLCHFGIKSKTSVGSSMSWIYFSNILGSTAGPLLTGFILLNYFTLEQNILYLSSAALLIAGCTWMICPVSSRLKAVIIAGIAIGITGMMFIHGDLYLHILEKLHYKTEFSNKGPYKYLVQNRSGIIAVESSDTDIIYGGGVYDGQFNIDPVLDTNGITRVYMIAALHPKPEDVLEIGMSSGSGTRVIADYLDVKKLTVVEINPGYSTLIKKYPDIATILNDPKISIHIDDGRRWLNRNPDKKFDLIAMNTTFHWRDGATNLLSEEFLRLFKSHLKKGGVIYYNTTFSGDVTFTAANVFKYIVPYSNFVAASDSPFVMSKEEIRQNLLKFRNAGKAVFDKNSLSLQRVLNELAASDLSDKADSIRNKAGLLHITDDNMATEFKINNRLFIPERTWANIFRNKF